MRTEQIGGERFTAVEPTPLLRACIDAGRAALEAALAGHEPALSVVAGRAWEFGPGTELTPNLLVTRRQSRQNGGGPDVPLLVVEFRTESTGRYILGPKRMVYSRFRVPEFWYADALNRRVAVLRSDDGAEYAWPPDEHVPGDVLEPRPFAGVRVPVTDLLGPAIDTDGMRARHPAGGEAWLAS